MISLIDFTKPLPDIGLFAKTRSGKDEVYKIISELGFVTKRVAFGDVMRENFFTIFPEIPKEPKPRHGFNVFGQALRGINEDVFVRPTMESVNEIKQWCNIMKNTPPSFIYTDIRQPNEYKAVKDSGAIMVKVLSHEYMRVKRMQELGEVPTEELLYAPTELHLDGFDYDYVVYNFGTLEDLRREVIDLIYKIQTRYNFYA